MTKSRKNKITMFNPKNNVKIETNKEFQSHWEKLGFIVENKIILFKIAV